MAGHSSRPKLHRLNYRAISGYMSATSKFERTLDSFAMHWKSPLARASLSTERMYVEFVREREHEVIVDRCNRGLEHILKARIVWIVGRHFASFCALLALPPHLRSCRKCAVGPIKAKRTVAGVPYFRPKGPARSDL